MSRTRLLRSLFVLLSVTPAEVSDVVGHEPVQASAGEDVVLPCRLNPPFDVSTLTVEWTRDGHTVHVYKDRKHNHPQDEQFSGRTSLFHHELSRGNISLKLTNVKKEDSGLYICNVPKLQSQVNRGNVSLTVTGFSDVVGHEPVKATVGDDVILPCHLGPPFDVNRLTVHWKWKHLTVHAYTNGGDRYDKQDEQFSGRTSMFHSETKDGNISLKLTNVTEKDSGLYSCYVPRLQSQVKRGNVLLTVNPRNEAGGREETGGNNETEDDQKESGDQTGAIAGGVVVAVLLVVILVSAVIAVYYYKRWRTEKKNLENHHQGEEAAELDPLNSKPVQNPQGADAE